jgi:hypothetical protein
MEVVEIQEVLVCTVGANALVLINKYYGGSEQTKGSAGKEHTVL